jgi:hypothetical protein
MWILALLLSAPPADAAPVAARVTIEQARVAIEATDAPLSAVLAALAHATDIQVTYDGPEPTAAVTVSVEAPTLVQAVTTLLDEQHLRYGLSTNTHGRLAAVVVVTRSVVAPAPPATPPPARTAVPALPPGTRPDPVASIQEPPMQDHRSPPDE